MYGMWRYKSMKSLCMSMAVATLISTIPVPVWASLGEEGSREEIIVRELTTEEMQRIKGGSGQSDLGCSLKEDCKAVSASECDKCPAKSVNAFTGEMQQTAVDVSLPGRGESSLELKRVYRSNITRESTLGYGWSYKRYDDYLEEEVDSDVIWHLPASAEGEYDWDAEASAYIPPTGSSWTLTKTDNGATITFTLTHKNGKSKVFLAEDVDPNDGVSDANPRLHQFNDGWANLVAFSYDGNDRLTKITDPSSRTVTFLYNGSGLVTKVTDPASNTVTYEYTLNGTSSNWDLTKATDQKGNYVSYAYDGVDNMTKLTDANGNASSISLSVVGRPLPITH